MIDLERYTAVGTWEHVGDKGLAMVIQTLVQPRLSFSGLAKVASTKFPMWP